MVRLIQFKQLRTRKNQKKSNLRQSELPVVVILKEKPFIKNTIDERKVSLDS